MSNPVAIAAVTATLRELVAGVRDDPDLGGAEVTALPPDLARQATAGLRQLNVFLYQVTPNGGMRNMDLPTRNAAGNLVENPLLALDLHYLITAYGLADDDLDAHHLLAYAMSLIHEQSILSRDEIRAALVAFPTHPELVRSDLAAQVEMVKLTPHTMTQEELFRLWSAFQTQYRLSVAYEASLVLVERGLSGRSALPVRGHGVTAPPMRRPLIERVDPEQVPVGDPLVLEGRELAGDNLVVVFGATDVVPASATDTRVEAVVPAALRAGVNPVSVRYTADVEPGQPPMTWRSEPAAFVLVPAIATPAPISVAAGGTLTLSIVPDVGNEQPVELMLGDRVIPIGPRPHGPPPNTSSSVDFPIPADVPTGDHLLRVRVDGAASPLEVDETQGSPTFGQYVAPVVTVT